MEVVWKAGTVNARVCLCGRRLWITDRTRDPQLRKMAGRTTSAVLSRKPNLKPSQLDQVFSRGGFRKEGVAFLNTPWRRGRDSNPRYGYPYSGFRDRPIQPL